MIDNIQPQQLIDYIGHTNAAIEKSAAQVQELAEIKQAREKIAGLIPGVVNALIENERIQPGQKDAAMAALVDHEKSLLLLQKLANHRTPKEVAAIGSPAEDSYSKTASYQPIGSRDAVMKPSDRKLFAAFGVAVD